MIGNTVWREFNPKAKDTNWMRRVLEDIQMKKMFLIKQETYSYNQTFSEGRYDTSASRRKYDTFNTNPGTLDIDFSPLDLWSNRLNAIVSMLEKMGFSPIATTTDPTASSKKEEDIALLKAEKALQPIREKFAKAIGSDKPLPVATQEDFSSDISPIKKLNLDISNPIDEGIFRDYLQRQIWEVALEVGIEHYLKENESNEKFKLLCADLVNQNCCASQVVINSYSGEPQLSYLYPFNVYTILAKQNDGKDAIAKGWEKNVSVRDVIGLMGRDITVDMLDQLLSLANTSNNSNFTGIWFPDRIDYSNRDLGYTYPYNAERNGCCEWGAFLNLTASVGYFEVKSQDSDLYIHRKENGNLSTIKESYDYNPPKNIRKVNSVDEIERDSDRYLEYKFYDVTYKCYYLPFTNYVFGFGKLPLAVRYGTKNELTDFSICTQRLKGKSMLEKCIPFIKHIFDLWCKIQHFINESRPSGESWDIDVVRELASEIIGTDANQNKTMEVLKALQNMTNTVHKQKTIDNQPVGGDGDPVKPRIRGLDQTVIQMYDLIQRDKNQIIEITGVSDVLLATQSTQAGLGVSQLALQQSLNTIYYIQSSIQKLFADVCFNFAQKIQWIVNGDKDAEAYKSIVKAIGDRNVEAIQLLGKNPPYSFSIFLEWGLTQIQREQVDRLTELLLQSKLLTAAQAFQIRDVKSWKIAAGLLSYYEAKSSQQQQQQGLAAVQAQSAASAQEHQQKMEEINAESQGKVAVADTTGRWNYESEKLRAENKIEVTSQREVSRHLGANMKHGHDLEKINAERITEVEED